MQAVTKSRLGGSLLLTQDANQKEDLNCQGTAIRASFNS